MFINYDEQALTKLFKTEPINIFEKEAGMFIYSASDCHGIKITINASIYENLVILILSQQDEIIHETKLNNVESLLSENDELRIHQSNAEQDIAIQFTPNLIVNYHADIEVKHDIVSP